MVKSFWIGVKRNRRPGRTGHVATLAILIVAGATVLMSTAESSGAERQAAAHSAQALNGTATARLHLVRADGSRLFEEGPLSGALTGSMQAELHTGAVFTGSFTIHTRQGSIKGRGQATPHGSGRYQSFSGSFIATGGSGRYTHVNGRAGLYGVFDRRSDSAIIQTTGTLYY
jgi:hypothetical protein